MGEKRVPQAFQASPRALNFPSPISAYFLLFRIRINVTHNGPLGPLIFTPQLPSLSQSTLSVTYPVV